MECFVIIVNGWKPLIIIKKRSILDVAAVLDRLCVKHLLHKIEYFRIYKHLYTLYKNNDFCP